MTFCNCLLLGSYGVLVVGIWEAWLVGGWVGLCYLLSIWFVVGYVSGSSTSIALRWGDVCPWNSVDCMEFMG